MLVTVTVLFIVTLIVMYYVFHFKVVPITCVSVLFLSIRALKGAQGDDVEIFAPTGICVTRDDGMPLGNVTQ